MVYELWYYSHTQLRPVNTNWYLWRLAHRHLCSGQSGPSGSSLQQFLHQGIGDRSCRGRLRWFLREHWSIMAIPMCIYYVYTVYPKKAMWSHMYSLCKSKKKERLSLSLCFRLTGSKISCQKHYNWKHSWFVDFSTIHPPNNCRCLTQTKPFPYCKDAPFTIDG